MRVIFLDIDGVLNCADEEDTARALVRPRHDLVALLDDLLDRTGAQIVLASTWRCDPKALEVARRNGLRFIDTLDNHDSGERGNLIRKWLSNHPEVECYVVVDDHASEHAGLPLFKCKTDVGLTPELVDDMVDYFERKAGRKRRSDNAASIPH
jgi:hypothetical protein